MKYNENDLPNSEEQLEGDIAALNNVLRNLSNRETGYNTSQDDDIESDEENEVLYDEKFTNKYNQLSNYLSTRFKRIKIAIQAFEIKTGSNKKDREHHKGSISN